MRWTALSGALIISFASTGAAQASSHTCSAVSSPWWYTLLIPFMVGGIFWLWSLLWNWWFTPPAGVGIPTNDPDNIAATQEARRTLPRFWEAFHNPAPDEDDFALKIKLGRDDHAEFIWVREIKIEAGRIYGQLANVPFEDDYELDQIHEINPDDIVDWCYYKADVAQGHYMTRVMFKYVPKRFVKRMQRSLGWAKPGWMQSVLKAAGSRWNSPVPTLRRPLPPIQRQPEASA